MRINGIILFVFSGLNIWAQECPKYTLAMDSGNMYMGIQPIPDYDKALIKFQVAQIAARECGMETKEPAIRLKAVFDGLKKQRDDAEESKREADRQKKKAEDSADSARAAREIAVKLSDKADSLKNEAKNQSYKTAPSEYARLIREGPASKAGILAESFDYKLTAYVQHLDTLKGKIASTKDKVAIKQYQDLIARLYFDNDLYEKIYACIENTTNKKDLLFKNVTSDPSLSSIVGELKLKDQQDKKITSFFESKKDALVIHGTVDNWIIVLRNGKIEDSIPMGARVTAIDFYSPKSIIYFGTESGDVGYILYDKNKKNQPVFENTLGTPVTAVGVFKTQLADSDETFLLATGKKSKAVVYRLDVESPQPDRILFSNALPEKKLIEITNAKFDALSKRIIIQVTSPGSTNSQYYSWNPFSKLAMEDYRKIRSVEAELFTKTQLY